MNASANVLVAQIEGVMVQMNQIEATFNARMGQIEARMGQIEAKMGQMEARVEANYARVLNSHTCNPDSNLYPIVKYSPGHPSMFPPTLPDFQFNEYQYVVGVPPPHGLVPETRGGIREINTARMNAIYWFYNDPLLASNGRNLDDGRSSLEQFLSLSW